MLNSWLIHWAWPLFSVLWTWGERSAFGYARYISDISTARGQLSKDSDVLESNIFILNVSAVDMINI